MRRKWEYSQQQNAALLSLWKRHVTEIDCCVLVSKTKDIVVL